MLWLAVTNLAKEFDIHSRFGGVFLVVVVERLSVSRNFGVSLSESWDSTPFKFLFNDIHNLVHELDTNCACRRISSVKMAAST